MSDTEHLVRQTIVRLTQLPADLPKDAHLYLDLGVASVHAMNLLLALEKQFSVQIPDDEFVEATSVARLADMIDRLLVEQVGEARDA